VAAVHGLATTRECGVIGVRSHLSVRLSNTVTFKSCDLRSSLLVADTFSLSLPTPNEAQNNAKRPFPCKIALRLKKICYKVSLCENCQRQSCKAFIGLTIRAKMIGEELPFTDTDPPACKSPIFNQFCLVAPQP